MILHQGCLGSSGSHFERFSNRGGDKVTIIVHEPHLRRKDSQSRNRTRSFCFNKLASSNRKASLAQRSCVVPRNGLFRRQHMSVWHTEVINAWQLNDFVIALDCHSVELFALIFFCTQQASEGGREGGRERERECVCVCVCVCV